jgi:hypothetical protein
MSSPKQIMMKREAIFKISLTQKMSNTQSQMIILIAVLMRAQAKKSRKKITQI